jgi:hypothetical protein
MCLHGNSNVVRCGVGFGYWDLETYQAGKWTIILKCNGHTNFDNGNAGCYVENNYCQNQNGYTRNNNYYMDYERWYSVVMGVKFSDSGAGQIRYWVNGTLIASYDNVSTATGSPNLNYIENFATLCQNAYDCPSHKENFDRLIFTTSISDIDGTGGSFNFFADPAGGGDVAPPGRVQGLTIQAQ